MSVSNGQIADQNTFNNAYFSKQSNNVAIGKTPPRKEQHWFSTDDDDVPWISIKDMNHGPYMFDTSECLTHEAVEKFNVRRIPDNTVLMSFKHL